MKSFLWKSMRYLYRKLPFSPRLKNKLKFFFFRLKNITLSFKPGDRKLLKQWIAPAMARAERVKHAVDLKFSLKQGVPKVSIIIPVYNNIEYTIRCLSSIINETVIKDYELIIVDDCSTDTTKQELAGVDGIKYIRNEKNAGFIVSCNNGADQAVGDYLVFLNNDTVVLPNWLESMIEVFETKSNTGFVGSMLLYPDGSLQEAGGIVWRDGSACNYGHLSNPLLPEFNYLRQVDYCSGACICIKADIFNQLDGFDRSYMPAYYEDTDIAFRIRQAGYGVYYQSASKVVHFEGVSSGVDLSSGEKKYQLINQKKFFDRWSTTLHAHNENGVNVSRERDRRAIKRMLVIDTYIPTPDKDSGSVRISAFMKLLINQNVKVVFVASSLAYDEEYTCRLQSEGIEVLYYPYVSSIDSYLKENGCLFDCVILSHVYVADTYLKSVRQNCPKATVVFDTVDLHFIRERRQAEIENDDEKMKASNELRDLELSLVNQSDITLVVSGTEKEIIHNELASNSRFSKSRVEVLSNIHTVNGSQVGYDERKDILFIGGFKHAPNVDAMLYFCKDIFPLIHAEMPDIKFFIIGSHVPKEVQKLEGNGIHVPGYVEDITAYFERIMLSVAPLRYGAGVKGKINSSMSYGVPVVSTSIGVEGMGLDDDEVVQADDATSFAKAVLNVYNNRDIWQRLSEGGMANVERFYSPDRAIELIASICDIDAVSSKEYS